MKKANKNMTISVEVNAGRGETRGIIYKHVCEIKRGRASVVIGRDECKDNGIPLSTALVRIIMRDGETATFNKSEVAYISILEDK